VAVWRPKRSRIQILAGPLPGNFLGQAAPTGMSLYVTKQYNLVPAYGRWRSLAGKVTAGLAESNGSLPPGGYGLVTCGLTACTPGSAPDQRSETSMGKLYLLRFQPANFGIIKACTTLLLSCSVHIAV